MSWCSPSNTPRFYDYTQIASLWSRLSACKLTRENSELVHNEISKIVLTLSQDTDRPLTVHGWKETVCASLYFLEKIRNIINIWSREGKISQELTVRIEKLLEKSAQELKWTSLKSTSRSIGTSHLGHIFWIEIPWDDCERIWNEEMERYRIYSRPWELHGITDMLIDWTELGKLTQIFAKFANNSEVPRVYLEWEESRHYLFWMHEWIWPSCAIPVNYTMGEYLRFNSPHNDLHLAHLQAINNWVLSYTDKMKERAYFEAVAVLSEKEFLDNFEKNLTLVEEIYDAFSLKRKQSVKLEKFKLWCIQMRGYELRLRTVRLLADFYILQKHMSFSDTVTKISSDFSLSEDDVAREVMKYIEFPGLGAVYTYGYRILEKNNKCAHAAIVKNGNVNITWSDFKNNQPIHE